ncbi:MAG: HEAT repeat domain-containing protein [Elusimicrobia bacterium]|nr:HEAT repeat domain-containing protein [Elusimicrobiota bacterium]
MRDPEAVNRVLEKMFAGLKSSDPDERIRNLDLLRGAPKGRAVKAVSELLNSEPEWMVRSQAIQTLQRNGGPELAPLFLSTAKKDSSDFVRRTAIRALSRLDGKRHIAELREFLKDKDPRARAIAAVELAYHGDSSGYDFAISHLDDPNHRIRAYAADAMIYAGKPETLPVLKRRLDSETSAAAQRSVVKAIRHIELLQAPEQERMKIIRTGFADADLGVRSWAAWELIERGDDAARAILKEVAADRNNPGSLEASQALAVLDYDWASTRESTRAMNISNPRG